MSRSEEFSASSTAATTTDDRTEQTMTPEAHYHETERLIAVGEGIAAEIRETRNDEARRDALGKQAMGVWAQAQVHATLARHG